MTVVTHFRQLRIVQKIGTVPVNEGAECQAISPAEKDIKTCEFLTFPNIIFFVMQKWDEIDEMKPVGNFLTKTSLLLLHIYLYVQHMMSADSVMALHPRS